MGAALSFPTRGAMASRFRRRRLCVLVAGAAQPAALREVSGRGAFLETAARPALGTAVELHHPDAGGIAARVAALEPEGIRLAFAPSERAVAFALAATAADMTHG